MLLLDRTPAVDSAGFNEIENRTISAHRWWTAAELRATTETVWPARLGELLDELHTWAGQVRAIA